MRPLDGVRVLALEQMQALPFATQLLGRLGAEIIKVEPPGSGDSGRGAQPALIDATGGSVGATFLRNNLGKRSIAVDLKSARGIELIHQLARHADVVCENLGPGRADRFGVGYEAIRATNPRAVYLSISGFGMTGDSPYAAWPAYAAVAEAMSGIYEYSRRPHQPPVINPVGGLGDTGTGLFAVIGVLAALRHRDATGEGQLVDVSMYDAMLSICDIVTNFWSMGVQRDPDEPARSPVIVDGFRAADGYFMIQVSRRHQFERLADVLDRPEWKTDPTLADPWNWTERLPDLIRPAIEGWAATRSKLEAARALAESGIAAAPCNSAVDVIADPHVALHRMLVEIPRVDGVPDPVLVAGNPVKMSAMTEDATVTFPTVGRDTDDVLAGVLGYDPATITRLREQGVVG